MAKIRTIKTSFNGGEISKQLYGRVDLESFIASNKQLYNVLPTVYGSAMNRGGTVFVNDNIKLFYKTLQEISGVTNIYCVSIDWSFEHYVFGCNDGKIARCDFDFDNVVVVQLTYGGNPITDAIRSIGQTGWYGDRNSYKVSTYAASYNFVPAAADWSSFSMYMTSGDSAAEKIFDLAPYSNPKRNNSELFTFDGKDLRRLKIQLAGTYSIEDTYIVSLDTPTDFTGFYIDDNNLLLRSDSSLFWYRNGTVISLNGSYSVGSNTVLGAKVDNDKINVFVYKYLVDGADLECKLCADVYDASGAFVEEKIIVNTYDDDYELSKCFFIDDKIIFVGEIKSLCLYRGAIFALGFTGGVLDYAIKDDKVLFCDGAISGNKVNIVEGYGYSGAKAKRVLVPFKINKTINYIIEFSDRAVRFYKNGQSVVGSNDYPYEISSPYGIDDLVDNEGKLRINYVQSVDVLYICHKDFPIQVLKRYGDANWVLEEFTLFGGPFDDANSDKNVNLVSTETEGLITVNAVNNASSLSIVLGNAQISSTDQGYKIIWRLDGNIIANQTFNVPPTYQDMINVLLNTADGANFIADYSGTVINVSVKEDSQISYSGKALKLEFYGYFISSPIKREGSATFSTSATPVNIFTDDMVGKLIRLNYIDNNTVMWESGKSITIGEIRKSGNNYYKATSPGTTGQIKPVHTEGAVSDGGVTWLYLHSGYGVGQILEKVSASQIKVNADGYFPDFTYGTYLWELGIIGGGVYPNCCALYKERFVFSVSTPNGTKICASNTGDYSNFSDNSFGDILPENAITVLLQGNQESSVLWMEALNKLYIGTACEEFVFGEQTIAEVLSPTNVACAKVSSLGSAAIRPLHILDEILFVSNNERQIANFAYIAERDTFRPINISLMFEHLLHKGVKCWAYTKEPYKTIWFADKYGNLRSVSYDADNKVCAAARHNVGGKVVSLAVIPEPNGNYDELWLVVEREIDGQTVYYTERLSWGLPQEDVSDEYKNTHGVFVDCAKVFDFENNVSVIDGLYWLEDKTVKVVVDGVVQADKVVSDGSITLDKPGKVVVVGLAYDWLIETIFINAGANDGTSQGLPQRVSKIIARFINTRYCESKASDGNRYDKVINEKSLTDDDREIHLPSDYSRTMTMFFKSDKPLACCILMCVKEMQTYQ